MAQQYFQITFLTCEFFELRQAYHGRWREMNTKFVLDLAAWLQQGKAAANCKAVDQKMVQL